MPASAGRNFLIAYRLTPWEAVNRLVQEWCPEGFELLTVPAGASPEQVRDAVSQADFLLGFWSLNEDDFRAARNLKLIQLMSAGYDRIDLDLAARYGVPVANNGGGNAIAVAEHTILLMLAVYRRLVYHHLNVKAGRWRVDTNDLYELWRKRVGIVGLGNIGRQVAKRLRTFESEVVYYDIRRPDPETEAGLGATFVPFEELLQTSDIVTLHVPLTRLTRHMIGARELAMMKPTAVLINTSRGAVVDEQALYEALRSGQIMAAGLDVLELEPPDPSNPLLTLENVVLTPHIAGPTVDGWPRILANCYANIQRVARGEPPLFLAEKYE
jgi:glyoxylate reductase/D-3-phosphoglycerate dehydrogenase